MNGPITPTCPRCGYDLSGLPPTWERECPMEGVCSECGYGFAWGEVHTVAVPPPWFIEGPRPRWKNLAPVHQTLRVALPWRFWGEFDLSSPLKPVRILWGANWLFVASWILAIVLWFACAATGAVPAGMPLAKYFALLVLLLPVSTIENFFGLTSFSMAFSPVLRVVVYASWFVPAVLVAMYATRRSETYLWRHVIRAWLYSLALTAFALAAVPIVFGMQAVVALWIWYTTGAMANLRPPQFGLYSVVAVILASFWLVAYWFTFFHRHLRLAHPFYATLCVVTVAVLLGGLLEQELPRTWLEYTVYGYYDWAYRLTGA